MKFSVRVSYPEGKNYNWLEAVKTYKVIGFIEVAFLNPELFLNAELKDSGSFKKNVSDFPLEEKGILKEKLTLMFENPRHPSLRTKKIQGHKSIFESTVTIGTRITWQYIKKDAILLRKVGPHVYYTSMFL